MASKKDLSERDICAKYIQPALEKAGWNPLTQIREEVTFTDGRLYVKGNLSSRGKRINEAFGKTFFTIMDFRNVTDLFADPDFDGDPVRVKEISEDDEIELAEDEADTDEVITGEGGEEIIFEPPEPSEFIDGGDIIAESQAKYYVNGVNVAVLNERAQYMDANGKLITGSLKDYTKQKVREQYQSFDDFLNRLFVDLCEGSRSHIQIATIKEYAISESIE